MAKADPEILRALFEREPRAAVEFLRAKGIRLTWNWQEMLDQAHARAFTVAKAAQIDVVRDIRRAVLDAAREGKTLRQFSEELTPLLQARGWWGKQLDVDGSEIQLGSPRRLRTIYQTNLQSAYMAGRMQTALEADAFPYLQYVAIEDERTRPTHAALGGQVFRKDDPIWDTHTPPNGFNCRCRVRPMSARQVEREGAQVRSSEGQVVTRTVDAGIDETTGEVYRTTQTGIRVQPGSEAVMWADVGFNSSPLAGHNFDALLLRKAQAALGEDAAYEAVARIVEAPVRVAAWGAFVANTLATGRPQGQTMTLGILPASVGRQSGVAPLVIVEDRMLVGPKPRRHGRRGDAPTRTEWEAMPLQIRTARWYRDTATGNLVGELPDGLYVVVSPTGAVDSAYRDALAAQKIRQRRWVPLEG